VSLLQSACRERDGGGRDERGVPMQEPASSKADTVAVETGEGSVLGGGI
jgi:hypothetical protein